jgi:hypothetical protein
LSFFKLYSIIPQNQKKFKGFLGGVEMRLKKYKKVAKKRQSFFQKLQK